MPAPPSLSRRERQVLDVLHRLGQATAADVRGALEDPPSDSAVRTHLRILEEKGHATHRKDGPRYVYLPTVATEQAGKGALQHLIHTFYEGAPLRAAAALLDDADMTESDLDRLAALIDQARQNGR